MKKAEEWVGQLGDRNERMSFSTRLDKLRGFVDAIQSDARADLDQRIAELERHLNRANASIKTLVKQSNDAIAKSAELERENAELKKLKNNLVADWQYLYHQGQDLRAQLAAAKTTLTIFKKWLDGDRTLQLIDLKEAVDKTISTPPAASLETVVEALKECRDYIGIVPEPTPPMNLLAAIDKALDALGVKP